jgi:hypothetical protein
MMFLNSATAILAPDLDMLQQMTVIYMYFAQAHGEQIMREVGVDAKYATPDPDALRAAFLVDPSVETLTFRDLQERRQDIRQKIQTRRSTRRRGGRAG